MGRAANTSEYTQAELELWERIVSLQNSTFYTAKKLPFRVRVSGNELFVDRRKKSITRASVNIAYKRWLENKDCGSKALGVFGASYIWAILNQLSHTDF